MSQPELEWDDEERALLKSAELDAPSPGAQTRTLAVLGVGGAALSAVVTAGSAQAAAVSAGKGLGLSKLLAVLAIGGAAGGAALHYRAQFEAKPVAQVSAPLAPATPTPPVAPALAVAPAAGDASATPEQLSPEVAKATNTSTRTEPDIALEIAALDRARRASESGNFSTALSELDQYDRAFKQGRLRPEALLLRIQTLISKGDAAGARALGTRFLSRYPKSPLSPRIQKLIGATK